MKFTFVFSSQTSRKSRQLELKERARLLLEQARQENVRKSDSLRSIQSLEQSPDAEKPKSPTDDVRQP